MHTTYLSLGTNLGDKTHNMTVAIAEIARRIGPVRAQSAFFETQPWGFESDNTFVNAAVRVETMLTPFDLLAITQQIERDMGRTIKSTDGTYHDRIIDIDILYYDDLHIDTPTLTIPHPLIEQREFVLQPLKQVLVSPQRQTSTNNE